MFSAVGGYTVRFEQQYSCSRIYEVYQTQRSSQTRALASVAKIVDERAAAVVASSNDLVAAPHGAIADIVSAAAIEAKSHTAATGVSGAAFATACSASAFASAGALAIRPHITKAMVARSLVGPHSTAAAAMHAPAMQPAYRTTAVDAIAADLTIESCAVASAVVRTASSEIEPRIAAVMASAKVHLFCV